MNGNVKPLTQERRNEMGFWNNPEPITMGLYRKAATLVALLGFIVGFGLGFQCNPANAADHAIVSFNDAEHLAALQDSVVDICDTTWWVITSTIELPNGCVVDSAFVSVVLDDSIIADSAKIYPYDITCRRLVGVEIETHRTVKSIRNPRTGKSMKITVIPGEAIIFYERSRR